MEIDKIVSGVLHNNTYVITNGQDTYIVDANATVDMLKPYLIGKTVKGILITHGHFDHVFSLESLLKEFDCKCFIHKKGVDKFTSVDLNCSYFFDKQIFDIPSDKIVTVKEGDTIPFGDDKITVIELPGHTNCGLGFVVDGKIFCGDTIFSDGYGRTDLATSSMKDLVLSVNKLNSKYKDHILYSGHGETCRVKRI